MKMINPRKFRFSVKNAINGLKYLYSSQNNVKIHLLVSICIVILGFLVKINLPQWGLIVLVIGIVWVVEAINTVFERLFDLLDETYNPIIKVGKDVSAAAVLISAFLSIIIGIFVFLPGLLNLFNFNN